MNSEDRRHRSHLPMPTPERTRLITYDARDPDTNCGSRGNAFNGTVKGVQLAIGEAAESSDHLVSPEEAIRIAMARQ